VPCDKDNKATKSQVILIEGLEVVFFFVIRLVWLLRRRMCIRNIR
jgi:hypothetical protein